MASIEVSCSSVNHLPATDTIYVTKTEYVDKIVVDSVWQDRWHTIYTSGDTIYARDSIYVYKYKCTHDTLLLTDTLYKVKNVPYEVEKEPSFWEKIGMMAKGGVLAIAMVFVGVGLLRLRDKYKVRLKQ
ncbi:MAG: hypothetical protein KBS62_07850 [Oscillospiraceae bacterium]|nr:hypothetical protein [Candidatus Ruminococcus equi]